MTTKKEIINWWEELGKETEDTNDYRKFWEKIDKNNLQISEKLNKKGGMLNHDILIMSQSWKYPIKLYFTDLECWRIVY